jgi:hypothetical protein
VLIEAAEETANFAGVVRVFAVVVLVGIVLACALVILWPRARPRRRSTGSEKDRKPSPPGQGSGGPDTKDSPELRVAATRKLPGQGRVNRPVEDLPTTELERLPSPTDPAPGETEPSAGDRKPSPEGPSTTQIPAVRPPVPPRGSTAVPLTPLPPPWEVQWAQQAAGDPEPAAEPPEPTEGQQTPLPPSAVPRETRAQRRERLRSEGRWPPTP